MIFPHGMVPFAFILDLMFFAVFGYPIYRMVSATLLSLVFMYRSQLQLLMTVFHIFNSKCRKIVLYFY